MCTVKAKANIARPTNAGLKILLPKPPKTSFPKPIASMEPIIGIHQGTAGGNINPNKKPVTTALPSPKIPGKESGYPIATASTITAVKVLRSTT